MNWNKRYDQLDDDTVQMQAGIGPRKIPGEVESGSSMLLGESVRTVSSEALGSFCEL
jgi:hypothetical protein